MLDTATIHAYIPVSDVLRARKFYEETLGLKPRSLYAGGAIYECGGATAFLEGQHRHGRRGQDRMVQGHRGEHPGHQPEPLTAAVTSR
jgi:hypothetical protein